MTAISTSSYDQLPRAERMQRTADLFDQIDEGSCPDAAATQEMIVLLNRCVAESIAARYAGRGIASDDLRQVAYLGLVKAVQRFDPAQGKDFLTFAVPTIRGEVQRYFRDHGWSVRPPRRIQEMQQRLGKVSDQLHQSLGREPVLSEIAEALGVDVDECSAAMQAYGCFQPTSLNQPQSGESDRTLGDLIPEDEDDRRAAEARLTLAPVVRELPAKDRRLLYLRFFEDRTQEEIGQELGVTQMQVSRRLSGIFKQLRDVVDQEDLVSAKDR